MLIGCTILLRSFASNWPSPLGRTLLLHLVTFMGSLMKQVEVCLREVIVLRESHLKTVGGCNQVGDKAVMFPNDTRCHVIPSTITIPFGKSTKTSMCQKPAVLRVRGPLNPLIFFPWAVMQRTMFYRHFIRAPQVLKNSALQGS